jgi:hypothetical protein
MEAPVFESPARVGGRLLGAAALGVLIVVGSAVLWIGVPIAGFWIGGRVTSTSQAFLLFVLGTVPASMVVLGWVLYRLDGIYERLRPREPEEPGRSAWLISLSDERPTLRLRRRGRRLVDVAMTASAVAALVLFGVWFFLFAGSPLAPMGP